ncbi:MAG: ATPase [Thermotogae bacterium]|nr:ATPase [Thermotogota bacterium]
MEEYLLSVDGGGTKTIAVLSTLKGEIIASSTAGPVNILENGEDLFRRNIQKSAGKIVEGLEKQIHFSCFGLPAVGEFENSETVLSDIIEDTIGIRPSLVVNDVVIGWAGGSLGRDSIHLVAGTGTIAYAKKGETEIRVSGWGSLIGDEGSAYYIGLEGLREVTKQLDGRSKRTILTDFVMNHINAKEPHQLIEWVYGLDEKLRRTEIAGLAILVYKAAKQSDKKATEILTKAAYELFECVEAAVNIMSFKKNVVSYSGSVLEKNEIVYNLFEGLVKERFVDVDIHKAILPPVLGGIILGMKDLGIEVNGEIVERLKNSF